MATLASNYKTLLDLAVSIDPDGKSISKVAEVLNQTNAVLEDMPMKEANAATYNLVTIRTGLATATLRALYQGTPASKGLKTQVQDTIGLVESLSQIDAKLLAFNKNSAEWRASEAEPHLEAMSQKLATMVFYGNSKVDQKDIMGLTPRYNSFSNDPTNSGFNVIDAEGVGSNNASIWLVGWGATKVYGFYPQGAKSVGLTTHVGPKTDISDENGDTFLGYNDRFQWDFGLTVKDWRYVARVANIDVSNLSADMSTGAKLFDLLAQLWGKIPNMSACNPVIYANRTILDMLRQQQNYMTNVRFDKASIAAAPVGNYLGIPIKRVDALLSTEASAA